MKELNKQNENKKKIKTSNGHMVNRNYLYIKYETCTCTLHTHSHNIGDMLSNAKNCIFVSVYAAIDLYAIINIVTIVW